ncbi:MAG TPA: hypothetical protein VE842_18760 [Pyrinomonadaceae bacterium]|nr:hypothetical protein [Pyrinomonadaceae bacterium]
MITIRRKAVNATAILLIFAVAQFYLQGAQAGTNAGAAAAAAVASFPGQGPPLGKLTTRNNQPIIINGTNVASGGTVLSGSTIETPDNVGASIDLGPLGILDIAPNTRLKLEFDENGNVKVTVIQGCVILRAKENVNAEVATEQQTVAQNDKKERGLDVCYWPGGSGLSVGQGAAAQAGAGTIGGTTGGGLTATEWTLIVFSTLAGTVGLTTLGGGGGTDPSPS